MAHYKGTIHLHDIKVRSQIIAFIINIKILSTFQELPQEINERNEKLKDEMLGKINCLNCT